MHTAEDFWAAVDRSGDCWLWRGRCSSRKGRPSVRWEGRTNDARRVALALVGQPTKPGDWVRPVCGVPLCVRPNHSIVLDGHARLSEAERFAAYVEKTETCWLWRGSLHTGGYGVFRSRGRLQRAHRFSWELENGPIPAGALMCHTCDIRLCVNPAHLYVGSHATNNADLWARHPNAEALRAAYRERVRGETNGNAKLSDEDVRDIRRRIAAGDMQARIAKEHGVSPSTIANIRTGRTWRHRGHERTADG